MDIQIRQTVTGIYKTGKYIGEITDTRPNHYVVKVLAVLKHPQQGDLHHPNQVDVPLFHERKALAYTERVNIPKTQTKPFTKEVPEYKESLKQALDDAISVLKKDPREWAEKSLEQLEKLKIDYKL